LLNPISTKAFLSIGEGRVLGIARHPARHQKKSDALQDTAIPKRDHLDRSRASPMGRCVLPDESQALSATSGRLSGPPAWLGVRSFAVPFRCIHASHSTGQEGRAAVVSRPRPWFHHKAKKEACKPLIGVAGTLDLCFSFFRERHIFPCVFVCLNPLF